MATAKRPQAARGNVKKAPRPASGNALAISRRSSGEKSTLNAEPRPGSLTAVSR